MKALTFSLLLLTPTVAQAQPDTLPATRMCGLDKTLIESSGLVQVGDSFWTHQDSGNPRVLLQIDHSTGKEKRSLIVTNAKNEDWEDLASDGTYLYIGDCGNNKGDRNEMKVYRILMSDLTDVKKKETTAEIISFTYEGQPPLPLPKTKHHWDCEAMVVMRDSIFLFTKNWIMEPNDPHDQHTHVYSISAEPGTHVARRVATYNAQGLVSGAAYTKDADSIALVGSVQNSYVPFAVVFKPGVGATFFNAPQRYELLMGPEQTPWPAQVEAAVWTGGRRLVVTNEFNTAIGSGKYVAPPGLWNVNVP